MLAIQYNPYQYINPYISVRALDLTIRIPKHAPSGNPILAEISFLGIRDTKLVIPGKQILALIEPLTSEIPKIDGEIQIFKNYGIKPIATLRLSKNRVSFSNPIKFKPGEILTISFVPKRPNRSNRVIIERASIKAVLIDFSYTNLSPLEVVSLADYDFITNLRFLS